MLDLTLIKQDVFVLLFFGATIAYLLRGNTTEILLQIIILAGIAWIAYGYLQNKSTATQNTIADSFSQLNKIGKERAETNLEINNISHFPKKGFIYLQKNQILMDIANDIALLKMFDRAKYGDLLVLMNQYQKTYIYILVERYYFESYYSTFIDLGDQILELMYSMYFVMPSSAMKHVYDVIPYELIEKNIERFTVLRRKMLKTLESFGKKQLGVKYIPESLPKPSDNSFDDIKTRLLP
jgi:hypothetical protein